ncbi:putative Type III secretion effector [Candidatus Regiella insecticola LSR1]|uniref:Putative Type III secretion effector n=1 Tax=Candidatus Regiella insecticola LSR1 TaxID=663321 RepID=E0WUA7_9ENTR|nr:type III secretion system inner rod subunit SctI [Candidatus Regiella insecticola]EFL91405.1 putative Type III secretion effector [Candidatus Regiella insecticola LSR1]
MDSIKNIQGIKTIVDDIKPIDDGNVSLEDRMLSAYSNNIAEFSDRKNKILEQINSNKPMSFDDTYRLQKRMGDYNMEVSLISATVRKVVGAAETLLRA